MRKRFNFSLQRVLDFRKSLEESAQQDLARARKQYQEQFSLVDRIKKDIEHARREAASRENINQGQIWLWNKYIDRLNFDLRFGELKLRELAREVSVKRQTLLEKSKDKKIIEKLKTNQKIRFENEQQKAEQKEFDEMAVVRFEPKTF